MLTDWLKIMVVLTIYSIVSSRFWVKVDKGAAQVKYRAMEI